ncbi:DUF732 domain-containing protein [Mycolicibacterium sp. XJ1819]
MRTTRFLASVAVAVGAATVFAAPVGAQSSVDAMFLDAVRDKGVPIQSDADALALAHQTCAILADGGSAQDGLSHIAKATSWSTDQAANFGSLAVVAYCKDRIAQATAPQQQSQSQQTPKSPPRTNVPKIPVQFEPLPLPPPQHHPYGPPRPPRCNLADPMCGQ